MQTKRRRLLILSLALTLGLVGLVDFVGPFVYQKYVEPELVRLRLHLADAAKPTAVYHTEIVTPTEIINHSKPSLTINDGVLEALGCPFLSADSDIRYCFDPQLEGRLGSFHCMSLLTPDPLLGGLDPGYPMAECAVGEGRYVYQAGCNIFWGQAFIIERVGEYELIDSFAELRRTFAPIETENEALSYALAATGYSAYYGMEVSSDYEYFVEQLEDTHVTEAKNGYLVHLYDYALCACRQQETFAVTVQVTRSGQVRQISQELVYRDAYESCID